MKFQTITGFRDILPPESALWNRVERTAREVFGTYGYGEIRLPILEPTELFARSVGIDTDIVSKEMYTFPDHNLWNLEGHRTELLLKTPTRQTVTSTLFLHSLTEFVSSVESALRDGLMPRTDDNRRDIEFLKGVAVGFPETEGLGDEAFELIVTQAKDIAAHLVFGDRVTLRPEATASVVRAYIQHGMHLRPGNAKLSYAGPMFRKEKPQKGRYRQFYQIGAELLGPSDHPALDAEVIEMLMAFFGRLQLKGTTLYLNSIGDKNCRPAYVEKLREELRKVKDQLGPDSQRRIETNPLRVLDSKLHEEQPIIEKLPHIADHLCDACREHYAEVKRQLALRGIIPKENWRLVRGLDYYTRTTFEITATGLGSQNAVCGGGRYDGLVELLGGPATTKGIGFAIGVDRLILSLDEAGPVATQSGIEIFLAWFGAGAYRAAVNLTQDLRALGYAVELPAQEMKLGKSLNLADRLGARYAVIIGEEELLTDRFTLKRLFGRREARELPDKQEKLSREQLLEYFRRMKT